MEHSEKCVALIIVFLIMTIILVIVLSTATVLFGELNILHNAGSSVSSFYAADTGIEKTLYLDRKQIPQNANRGFCSLGSTCNNMSSDNNTHCYNVTGT